MNKYLKELLKDIFCATFFVAVTFFPLWLSLAMMKPL
jgi:hypothetical protein